MFIIIIIDLENFSTKKKLKERNKFREINGNGLLSKGLKTGKMTSN